MHAFRDVLFGTSLFFAVAPAVAQEAEVIHWWTSGGESAAVKVFADRFNAAGGTWVDTAIAGAVNARTAGINRIVGGNPPTSMQFNTGAQFDEIVANELVRDLDAVAEAGGWQAVLPEPITRAITREGHVYAVPVNIHGENWLWYNTTVFEQAGLQPPANFDEVLQVGPKLEQSGVTPLAIGGDAWQQRLVFYALLLDQGGAELYAQVLGDKDVEAIRSDAFRNVAEMFGELRSLAEAGTANWNDATNQVITGQAAMQVMGDWAKGEFIAAGQSPGEEYGCVILGDQGYIIGGDVFVFPVTDDPAQEEAQIKLAEVMLAPETQIAFNTQKGSIPVRMDVDVSGMDQCAQAGMAAVRQPDRQIESVNILFSNDLRGATDDVITQYWSNPDMDTDTFIENFVSAVETAG